MLWGGTSCRSIGSSAAHLGRLYRCCAVAPHQTWPWMLCVYGTERPDVLEALQGSIGEKLVNVTAGNALWWSGEDGMRFSHCYPGKRQWCPILSEGDHENMECKCKGASWWGLALWWKGAWTLIVLPNLSHMEGICLSVGRVAGTWPSQNGIRHLLCHCWPWLCAGCEHECCAA